MMKFIFLASAILLSANSYAASTPRNELIFRVSSGKPADVSLLATKIGNVNYTDEVGWPLLAIAASRTDAAALEVVEALVEAGANVNYGGPKRNYPLFLAVQSGNEDVVRYLLEQGADFRAKDLYGMSVMSLAEISGNNHIKQAIRDAVEREKEAYISIRSPEAFSENYYQLAWQICAHQYEAFYFQSKQDMIPEAEQRRRLAEREAAISRHYSALRHYFLLNTSDLKELMETVRLRMSDELERLVSNRWRRQQGVGSADDLRKRCDKISAPYSGKSAESLSKRR